MERTTVHISDDTGRMAMLETRTIGTAAADNDTLAELTRYIYSNHLQSASLELDEAGAIISYEEYHPYGTSAYQAKSSTIKATAKRYRYTGKERDEESGLYYHGARYYIPWLYRWSAVDPLESKYAGMSSYNYSFNNPVMFNDPSGMEGENIGSWISTPNKMTYNSQVEDADIATKIYGNDAIVRNPGYTYTSSEGVAIVLGQNGVYTSNGEQHQAPDDSAFVPTAFNIGLALGFSLNAIATVKFLSAFDLGDSEQRKDVVLGLYGTAKSINSLTSDDDSEERDKVVSSIRSSFLTFQAEPSLEKGKDVGSVVEKVAENAALSYIMGTVSPRMPIRPVAAFEESFPGWKALPPRNYYIPGKALEVQEVKGVKIPLPDIDAGDFAHTTLGFKISSVTGKAYRQSATFGDGIGPTTNGKKVPYSIVDWTDHGTPWHHTVPHQHPFFWGGQRWERTGQGGIPFFKLIFHYKNLNSLWMDFLKFMYLKSI
ncbi:RHS repeat domain-containing protein [Taibaiella koreensis]|uniref:RHS repeat domain-containing protein n=1 Tax=Taibaiella koreensis TaxID=1268548 RepID=UPI0013C3742C|nr:RHS repeat-associated core domain-containing protein [Taibaiella koreensis]